MKTHLITYGDGDVKFSNAAERLAKQARLTSWFQTIEIWDLCKLKEFDFSWVKIHSEFINNNKRGHGYWVWKPKTILSKLQALPEGDILIYTDAGCEINKHGYEKLLQYSKWASYCGMVAFYLNGPNYTIAQWTKKCLLDYFSVSPDQALLNYPQVEAGVLILKNNLETRNFISMWLDISLKSNYVYINDEIKRELEAPEFIEHRHDQAIFSLLHYTTKFGISIRNENYFPELWAEKIHPRFAPIAAFRNLSPNSKMEVMSFF
jgi:hypothetical protein